MSRRIVLLIALLGVGFIAVGVLLVSSMLRTGVTTQAALATPVAQQLTEQVVVVRADLPLGAILKPEHLMQVEVPLEMASPDVLRDVDQAAGRITKIPLVAGELVMNHHLADPTNVNHDLAFTLTDDQVLMAFPAEDLLTSLNLVQRGDLVDILISFEAPVEEEQNGVLLEDGEEQQDTKLYTFDALQRAEVSAVVVEILEEGRRAAPAAVPAAGTEGEAPAQPTPEPAEVRPQAVLLALSPQDALVLKHLKDAGGIVDIVLRAPTSERIFELSPVMPEYLIDRYQLVTPR